MENKIPSEYNDLAGIKDPDLIELLDKRHPDFEDVYKIALRNLDISSNDRERIISQTIDRSDETSGESFSECIYIPKAPSESISDYTARLKISEISTMTWRIVSEIVGNIYNPAPSYMNVKKFSNNMENVDIQGRSFQQVMTEACRKAITAQFCVVLVDSNKTDEMGEISKQQASELGIRPILKTFDPRYVADWHFDAKGLAWVHLLAKRSDRPSFDKAGNSNQLHIIVDRWKRYHFEIVVVDGKQTVKVLKNYSHGVDGVPAVFVNFAQDEDKKLGIGKSFIDGSVPEDLKAIRADSHRQTILQVHGTPHLWRRLSDSEFSMVGDMLTAENMKNANSSGQNGMTIEYLAKKLQVGIQDKHVLIGADAEIGYTQLDVAGLDQFGAIFNEARKSALENVGFDSATILNNGASRQAQSGASKSVGFQVSQGQQVEYLSKMMSQIDTRILKIYADVSGATESEIENVLADYPQPTISAPFKLLAGELEFFKNQDFPPEFIKMLMLVVKEKSQLVQALSLGDRQKSNDIISENTELVSEMNLDNDLTSPKIQQP